MSHDVECPYCGAEQEINHDDGYGYEEDRAHQQQCRECEKTFVYYTSIVMYYDAEKADCLNGEPHPFKEVKIIGYPEGITLLRCPVCGEEKRCNENSKNPC